MNEQKTRCVSRRIFNALPSPVTATCEKRLCDTDNGAPTIRRFSLTEKLRFIRRKRRSRGKSGSRRGFETGSGRELGEESNGPTDILILLEVVCSLLINISSDWGNGWLAESIPRVDNTPEVGKAAADREKTENEGAEG